MWFRVWAVVAIALLTSGCASPPQPARPLVAPPPKQKVGYRFGEPVPQGDLRKAGYLLYAIYYEAREGLDLEAFLRTRLAQKYPHIVVVEKLDDEPTEPQLKVFDTSSSREAPPRGDELDRAGYGFEPSDRDDLGRVNRSLAFELVYPKEGVLSAQRDASRLVAELAAEARGFAWDDTTGEIFTRAAWQARGEYLNEPSPALTDQITSHLYATEGGYRLITLGMVKFGLPELVIERLPRPERGSRALLLDIVGQTLFERGALSRPGRLELDLSSLKSESLRRILERLLVEGATGKGEVELVTGRLHEGDPQNRLIEIAFPPGAAEARARQDALLTALFGTKENVFALKRSRTVEEGSSRAMKKLLQLKPTFQKWPHGGLLLVKAPFRMDSGDTELLWVLVAAWEGTRIYGILEDGTRVSFDEGMVVDYLHRRADGSTDGNETEEIERRREEEEEKSVPERR